MVGHYNHGVPTAVELENNSNQKKYTVNRKPGGLVISKPLCTLMAIGTILLAVLVGLIVFFLVPRCNEALTPSSQSQNSHDLRVSDDVLAPLSDSPYPSSSNAREIDERLPRSIEPTHYRIEIRLFLDNLTTQGSVVMELNVKEESNDIVFHVKDIEIDEGSITVVRGESAKALSIKHKDYIGGQRYKITLEEPLVKNSMYSVRLNFKGHLNSQLRGIYRSEYEDLDFNGTELTKKQMASSQMSPVDARRAFPCFDEPSFKANFSITITRPRYLTSLSNMPLDKSEPDTNNKDWVVDYYKTTPKMSTYLVALLVSDLQGYGSSEKLIKIWSRRYLSYQTRYAAEVAPTVLHFFEDYFQIKFPLPKIDIVAIPDFGFSAMENWGLITFREHDLLFDENSRESDIDNKRSVAVTLSHEIVHQWFGNLVTPKSWSDLWLKEGFATYLQYLGTSFAEPSWKIDEEFIITETNRAFAFDALASSHAISSDVKSSKQILQAFDDLSYGKGACIIRMMNHFLGEETFKAGLINFLKKYEYGNADRSDLFKVLTEEAHKKGSLDSSMNINEIMSSWTQQPGFPVITAIADKANKKLILSQKRFTFIDQKSGNSTWWVPISVMTDLDIDYSKTKPLVWLKNEPMLTINLNKSNWYLININQTGYFIVNYDETNWRLLSDNIMSFPPLIRAQLISDSMDLARANLLDYDIPLKLIQRMALHDEFIWFVPTTVAFNKLEFLSDMLAETPIFGLFEEFQSTIFKNTYRTVDANTDYFEEDYLKQKIRKAVLKWACRKTDSSCAIKSHHMFRWWMEKNMRVAGNLRDVVYCTAIRQGTEAEWNFAYGQFLQTTSIYEANVLLDALGCTTKKWLLSRYLGLLARNDSSIRIQDAGRVFKSVANNNIANTLAFDFLRENWNELLHHYGDGFKIVSDMVTSLARFMNNEYQLAELIRFRNKIKDNIGAASQAFDSTIEKVRANVQWMQKNYHSVEKWLVDRKNNYNL